MRECCVAWRCFPVRSAGGTTKLSNPTLLFFSLVAKRFPFPRCTKPAKPRCAHDSGACGARRLYNKAPITMVRHFETAIVAVVLCVPALLRAFGAPQWPQEEYLWLQAPVRALLLVCCLLQLFIMLPLCCL